MMDWRNETTNPQHVGVAVVKSRRSNFDGVWPPGSKPAAWDSPLPMRRSRLCHPEATARQS